MLSTAPAVRHFLAPLLCGASGYSLHVERSGVTLATTLETAFDSKSRNRGLLGRDRLDAGAALVLAPCSSVHTFLMRFPIDVVFVRKDGTVAKVCATVKPMRVAIALGAFAVIELPAGRATAADTRLGDRLTLNRRA